MCSFLVISEVIGGKVDLKTVAVLAFRPFFYSEVPKFVSF